MIICLAAFSEKTSDDGCEVSIVCGDLHNKERGKVDVQKVKFALKKIFHKETHLTGASKSWK